MRIKQLYHFPTSRNILLYLNKLTTYVGLRFKARLYVFLLLMDVNEWISYECSDASLLVHIHQKEKIACTRNSIKNCKCKGRFPLRPYRTVTYRWACADWKEVYKSTYFRVYSSIKIKSSSQVNFLAYYGSTNQSTFTKFWNLKFVLIRYGTLRLKWKTALNGTFIRSMYLVLRLW